jgi:hypothetical protein
MTGVCFARATGWPERVIEVLVPGSRLGPGAIPKGRSPAGTVVKALEVLLIKWRVDMRDRIGRPRHRTRMQEGR